jgi:TonB family protein
MKYIYAHEASKYGTVGEYRLTIIDGQSLIQRLTMEIHFVVSRTRQRWPELRSDPVGFGFRFILRCKERVSESLREPNILIGSLAAIVIVSFALLLAFSKQAPGSRPQSPSGGPEAIKETFIINFSTPTNRIGSGIGAGSMGRVGFADGKGEGSKQQIRPGRGGGGSGKLNDLPPQRGRLFQPSQIPAVLPTLPVRKNPSLPLAGIDIDPMLWKNQAILHFGDPRSRTDNPSRGPGEGGNFGIGKGPGTGEGDGPGFGPGENGNMGGGPNSPGGGGKGGSFGNNPDGPNHVYRVSEVTQRARVLTKPEPQYTEEARRAQITGTVVLRVVFSSSGQVTNIRAVHSLPFGLTERAITAARQIHFLPAFKGGRPVSVYMQLEYNFNLY